MEGVAVITVVPAGVLTPPIEDTGPPRVALDGGVAAVGIWGGGGVGLSSISSSEERGGVGVSPATPCVTWGGEGLLGLAVTVAVLATEEGVASLSSLFILMRSVEKMVENFLRRVKMMMRCLRRSRLRSGQRYSVLMVKKWATST